MRNKPFFKVPGNIVPIEGSDLLMSLFEGDLIFAAALGPAETILEDIICLEGFKFGAAIVPSQLLASPDLSNCEEVENTLIVIFNAGIRLAAVVDQYSR